MTEVGENVSGNITITAGNDINIGTLQLRNRSEEHWGNKKSGSDRITDTTANLQSEISSSGSINIASDNDTTLQAAKLTAQENIDINAAGNLLLLTAQNTSFKMESIRKNKTFTFKNNDNGFVNSEVLNNEFMAGQQAGGLEVVDATNAADRQTNSSINLSAQNTAYLEYKSGSDLSQNIQSQLQNLKAETILTNPIEEIHQSWNKSTSGLNQTGMIIMTPKNQTTFSPI